MATSTPPHNGTANKCTPIKDSRVARDILGYCVYLGGGGGPCTCCESVGKKDKRCATFIVGVVRIRV